MQYSHIRMTDMTFSTITRSTVITGLEWLSERIPYPEPDIKGDTFPMTWADDDEIYTSAGDPLWGESRSGLDVEKFSGMPPDYKITKVHHMNEYLGWGGDGPKPSGMICVDGILYLAFQNMLRTRRPPHSLISQHGSDAQIVYSTCHGHAWVPCLPYIGTPMFLGHKFGGPAFVNFGKNNARARDQYVYAVSTDQWDNGSNLRLGRVPQNEIMRREAWEFVCAFGPGGEPAWHYDLEEAIPILSLHRWISLAGIQRYLLLTWRLHKDFSPDDGTDLLVLEAPEPWGPFSLVHFEEYWEGRAFTPYCSRLPLKWMEADGITGWLQFSGSWGSHGQAQGHYRSHIRKFRLKLR
jgi:hypothetical protein